MSDPVFRYFKSGDVRERVFADDCATFLTATNEDGSLKWVETTFQDWHETQSADVLAKELESAEPGEFWSELPGHDVPVACSLETGEPIELTDEEIASQTETTEDAPSDSPEATPAQSEAAPESTDPVEAPTDAPASA